MVRRVEDPVVVVPYDEAWPSLFEQERDRIERAVGPWVEEIVHIGSTAVPGLAAKPVIDIMMGVRSLGYSPILIGRFRDYLRRHPGIAEEYARLKYELSGRFHDDRIAYTEAKTAFIREIVRRAGESDEG
jgi:GrpB-like predicted nucleotidyltransferase (UPF0157 family)